MRLLSEARQAYNSAWNGLEIAVIALIYDLLLNSFVVHDNHSLLFCMQLDDWKSDQYRWRQNGCKQLPESNPIVQKRYFVADTPEGKNPGFKRHAYKLIDATNNCTLVHYLGDDSIGSQYPHGNCKAGMKKAICWNLPFSFSHNKTNKGLSY